MHESDSTKRIPKSLGTDAKLFGTYTLTDLAVALIPAVVVVLLVQVVLPSDLTIRGFRPQTLTLPLAAVAVGVGFLFVYLTPGYTTSVDWLSTVLSFHRGTKTMPHEAAKEYTQIERVHPERGAIEQTDGAFVGLVQVNPPTMALATDAEWAAKAESFCDFCNTAVQFPVQLFSTTHPFPVEEYLSHYEDRLDDQDVRDNPRLAALIENYVSWYAADLDERRMTIRDHYVVVTVRPDEVRFERESLTRKLASVPILGLFVQARFAPRIEEQQAAMFDALDERLRQIEAGLREIEGCHAQRIDVNDATTLVGEYWAGEVQEHGEMRHRLRTASIIGGPR